MENMEMVKNYFNQTIGSFYTHAANRLMLYPFIFSFLLLACMVFWLLYLGPSFVLNYMAFAMTISLYAAGIYSICILGADILAHRLTPSLSAYQKRTIGQQWLIWSVGLGVGLLLQQTMKTSFVIFFIPDAVEYFRAHPDARLGTGTLLMMSIPYWGIVMFLTLQVARSKQRIQQQANALMVIPEANRSTGALSVAESQGLPNGILQMSADNDNGTIPLAEITHITVEDHYCRIHYADANDLTNKLIRMPIKKLLLKLPQEHFLHIHRSHVVNTGHISRLIKNGRDHKVVLRQFDVELPISRSRFKDVLPRLTVAASK